MSKKVTRRQLRKMIASILTEGIGDNPLAQSMGRYWAARDAALDVVPENLINVRLFVTHLEAGIPYGSVSMHGDLGGRRVKYTGKGSNSLLKYTTQPEREAQRDLEYFGKYDRELTRNANYKISWSHSSAVNSEDISHLTQGPLGPMGPHAYST